MITVNSNIFQCEECKHNNDISYNRGNEIIDGIYYETRECYYCKCKYKFIDKVLYAIPKPKIEINHIETTSDNKNPIYAYVVIGLMLFGGFCLGMEWVPKIMNKKQVADKQSNVNQASYTPTNNTGNCDFDLARKKALAKLKVYGLSLVDDKFQPNKDYDKCQITYILYVKKIKYDMNGKSYLEDKVYQCNLTYKIIAKDFEYMEGTLMELNNNRSQNIP
jgi:hypothetical protein